MQSIRPPQPSDWHLFERLAADEGWRVPRVERDLFRGPWSGYARVFDDDSVFCGLVTAVAHQRSGWIGNLIVPPERRGRGYGARLFRSALGALQGDGVATIWLTASAQGRPLYEREGFMAVSTIERWQKRAMAAAESAEEQSKAPREVLFELDRAVWLEERTSLLRLLAVNGEVFAGEDGAALLQKGEDLQIIGPWYAHEHCPRANRLLLQQLLAAADAEREIVIDLVAMSPLRTLLAAAGFEPIGENTLMVRGEHIMADLQKMVSLASLGSVG